MGTSLHSSGYRVYQALEVEYEVGSNRLDLWRVSQTSRRRVIALAANSLHGAQEKRTMALPR